MTLAVGEFGRQVRPVREQDDAATRLNEPDGPGTPDTATATLTLAESDLQIADSGELGYEVVGGTVTYDPVSLIGSVRCRATRSPSM